jgi:predicted DNA-binding ribbon-helix-helix protein
MDFQAELTKFGSSESKILSNYKTLLQHAGTMKDAELADQIQAQVVIPWSAEHQSLQKLTGLPKPQQHLVGMLLDYMDERQHGFANMVHGLRTHNVELVKQSLKQQMDAQTKLQAAIRVPQ